MESRVVLVQADSDPIKGIAKPGPHQRYKNPRISVENRMLPALRPDEVRVKMIYAGVCGTDVHLVTTNPDTGYIQCSAPAQIPAGGRVIGHEGIGKVLEVGSQVHHVQPGACVTFESIIACHYCDECRRGDFNQCRHALLLGMEKDGLFGDIVDVPSMITHDVNEMAKSEKGLRAAACVEPAAVAYVACQNTHLEAGDVVVIFGAGPIGLFAAMLSKVVFGASRVHIVEPVPFRRKIAKNWGDDIYDIDEFFNHGPSSIDVVMEASGNMGNINRVFRRLNANGCVAILGRSGEPLLLDAVDHMITNEISLIGSRGHLGGAFAKILSLCRSGRLSIDDAVTDIINGPEEICNLLKSPEKIFEENCKVLVKFDTDWT
ncbi:MAG TPA: alcohol dehydrogenase catalytic domain-containing protein [Thermodesulfobacteriota bacterium]|jgi:threonine dehydrogenase-like Zn-dependent dehydrogenase|nr:alcohol dehydrogenase catalytic domain-containing protein [Thermodesulfobacteriota bacterium]